MGHKNNGRAEVTVQSLKADAKAAPDTSKPSAVFVPEGPRRFTVSFALPGSVIANCQTLEQKTALAGQIARAAAIFQVDEVIVFDESASTSHDTFYERHDGVSEPNVFLGRLLQYLETPQFLRKQLFPMHRDLRLAGQLPSLDLPHHVRADETMPYREGVAVGPADTGAHRTAKRPRTDSTHTLVDCGLASQAIVPGHIEPGTRVTLSMKKAMSSGPRDDTFPADIVSASTPREKMGYYWGYDVRMATSLSDVFVSCPFAGGYDVTVGTSERGTSVPSEAQGFPQFKHLLVVLGGVAGLEPAVEADPRLDLSGPRAGELFDLYLNVCEHQGSRTIRTEEALMITLARLYPLIRARGKSK